MRSIHTLLLGLTVLMPTVCQGQAKCPWMNAATAGGILGGTVAVTLDLRDQGSGSCEFSHQQGAVRHLLTISVSVVMTEVAKQFSVYLGQCSPKTTPLRAIGNEAVMCTIQTHTNLYAERVVGRVRNQAFLVTVSSSVQDDPSMTQEMRREKAHLVAEQVAGILF